uniref:Ovule protein n=1 Tax=Panagrellus redivivus TaxID=6233 RepID=A0A7E4VJ23_PANRE
MVVSSVFDAIWTNFSKSSAEPNGPNPTVPPQNLGVRNPVPNQWNGFVVPQHNLHSSHSHQIPVQQLLHAQKNDNHVTTNAGPTSKSTTSAPNPNPEKQSSRKRKHPEGQKTSEFDSQPSPFKQIPNSEPPPRPPMRPLSEKCKRFSIDYIVYGRLPL